MFYGISTSASWRSVLGEIMVLELDLPKVAEGGETPVENDSQELPGA